MVRLYLEDMCNVIRTKNAGPFLTSIDILFRDHANYRVIKENSLITKEIVAQLYGISVSDVVVFENFDNVSAIKATIRRKIPSGSPGDSDCYSMNQEVPLLQLSFAEEFFADT